MRSNPGRRSLPVIAAIGFVLAGCAGGPGPQADAGHSRSRGYYKVGAPYQVNGVWYYPKVDYSYDETGTASWYGEAFNGKPTANGEVFDLNQVSAAHKTLQLPSVVEVTNLKNGRALQVRVNDRGPYVGDRIIDLSRRAAQLLGFESAGTAPVRVRIMKEESIRVAEAAMRGNISPVMIAEAPRPAPIRVASAAPRPAPRPAVEPAPIAPVIAPAAAPAPVAVSRPIPGPPPSSPPPPVQQAAPAAERHLASTAPRRPWPSLIASAHAEMLSSAARTPRASPPHHGGRIFIQAGAFAVAENAKRLRARIAALGSAEVSRATVNGAALYRVRVGPLSSEAEARRVLSRIVASGYPGARLIDE
jgi:rare lipoprotein A